MSTDKKSSKGFKRTPAGWVCVFLLVWLPLAGTVTGNNFLFLTVSMLIGFVGLSRWLGRKNLETVSVKRILPGEIFANTPFEINYVATSSYGRQGSMNFRISEEEPLELSDGPIHVERAPWDESLGLKGSARILKRGEYSIPALWVHSRFPFGLATRWTRAGDDLQRALVFPQIIPVEEFIPRELTGPGARVEHRDIFGTIPHTFREYVPGDPYKRIQWKISARLGKLHVQERSEEAAGQITIRVGEPASEETLSRAASLVYRLSRGNNPITLEGQDFIMGPDRGEVFAYKLLSALALWEDRPRISQPVPSGEPFATIEIDPQGDLKLDYARDGHDAA
jgi:uncharacterized protein (DUF58 family)